MTRLAALAVAAATLVSACSHTEKLAAQEPYDLRLSCAQINAELARADSVMQEARRNKGVNTANVAAALLFWPAVVGNYMDASKGEDLAANRRQNLIYLARRQNCPPPGVLSAQAVRGPVPVSTVPTYGRPGYTYPVGTSRP